MHKLYGKTNPVELPAHNGAMICSAAAPGHPKDWKWRPGMLICCNKHGHYFAEICCPADANHSAWLVRGIFCASITTLDEENINVISMDELRLIREWMKPFTEMKSYPFRQPYDCSEDHGRMPAMHYFDKNGYMQLAPLPIRGPSPPICVREVSQELRRLVEKYQHHAWSVAETRIQEEGFHRDDVNIVV